LGAAIERTPPTMDWVATLLILPETGADVALAARPTVAPSITITPAVLVFRSFDIIKGAAIALEIVQIASTIQIARPPTA